VVTEITRKSDEPFYLSGELPVKIKPVKTVRVSEMAEEKNRWVECLVQHAPS
jgi:hypothetical protein